MSDPAARLNIALEGGYRAGCTLSLFPTGSDAQEPAVDLQRPLLSEAGCRHGQESSCTMMPMSGVAVEPRDNGTAIRRRTELRVATPAESLVLTCP